MLECIINERIKNFRASINVCKENNELDYVEKYQHNIDLLESLLNEHNTIKNRYFS